MEQDIRLQRLAEQLKKKHAEVLGALEEERHRLARSFSEKKATALKNSQRETAILRNLMAQQIYQQTSNAREMSAALLEGEGDVLAACEYLQLGTLAFGGEPYGTNETEEVPFVLPFLGHTNLWLTTPENTLVEHVRQIVWQVLQQTAPGQLDILAFDPALTGAMSSFSALRQEDMLSTATEGNELEGMLDAITQDIQQVNDTMRGTATSLTEFRRKAQQPVGRYKLVAMIGLGEKIGEPLFTRLLALAKSAPSAGISFLFVELEGQPPPKGANLSPIKALANVVAVKKGQLLWQQHGMRITLPLTPPEKIAAGVDALVRNAAQAAAPSVLLSSLEDTSAAWSASSANGISFVLGKAGMEAVEVRLGDDMTQKHNVLISGAVGQGKSNLIKVIIHSLCSRYSPRELRLYMLDFKEGVTLFPFSNQGKSDYLPHAAVLGLESDRAFGLAVLEHLESEFNRRAQLFKPYGDNIALYRKQVPDAEMPRIVLIIDEFHFLFNVNDSLGEAAAAKLEALARKGRAYGMHIILASQSVTGASALLTKEDGVFGQFPIRIALKNHLAESYATFVQGNDAATRLRVRGQAVLNSEYGAPAANRFLTVAWAPGEELDAMRIGWWRRAKGQSTPPAVFDGSSPAKLASAIPALHELRHRVVADALPPTALLGQTITIGQTPAGIPMGSDSGRNIAILGAGSAGSIGGEAPQNAAVGLLQSIGVSLALQTPKGNAQFVVQDLLDPPVARMNNQPGWLSLMERLGFAPQVIARDAIPQFLHDMAEALPLRDGTEDATYILAFGMDRAGNITTPDPISSITAADSFQHILRSGSQSGVHFIGWWSSLASYNTHLGYGAEGYIETKIILWLDEGSTQSVLGPFVHWQAADNRALVVDQTNIPSATTILPYKPITEIETQKILAEIWE